MLSGYNFTEHVRIVLARAREEAAALRHEYVGTEHMLIAMLRSGDGVGYTVIENLGGDPAAMIDGMLAILKHGTTKERTGPDLPYTSRAKKVLELAMGEARAMSHSYIGTEHLLLGLIREEKGVAAQVLVNAGVTYERAREEVLRVLGTEMDLSTGSASQSIRLQGAPIEIIIRRENGDVTRRTFTEVDRAIEFLKAEQPPPPAASAR